MAVAADHGAEDLRRQAAQQVLGLGRDHRHPAFMLSPRSPAGARRSAAHPRRRGPGGAQGPGSWQALTISGGSGKLVKAEGDILPDPAGPANPPAVPLLAR